MQVLTKHESQLAEFCCAVCHKKMDRKHPGYIDCAFRGIDGEYCPDLVEALQEMLENQKEPEPEYPRAIYKFFVQREYEAVYACPECGNTFSDHSFNHNGRRCPKCKTKLSGIPW